MTHRSLRVAVSEEDRAIPNESADPEQHDRDEGIDLQGFMRQLCGDTREDAVIQVAPSRSLTLSGFAPNTLKRRVTSK
jgi:hypothetical protein